MAGEFVVDAVRGPAGAACPDLAGRVVPDEPEYNTDGLDVHVAVVGDVTVGPHVAPHADAGGVAAALAAHLVLPGRAPPVDVATGGESAADRHDPPLGHADATSSIYATERRP